MNKKMIIQFVVVLTVMATAVMGFNIVRMGMFSANAAADAVCKTIIPAQPGQVVLMGVNLDFDTTTGGASWERYPASRATTVYGNKTAINSSTNFYVVVDTSKNEIGGHAIAAGDWLIVNDSTTNAGQWMMSAIAVVGACQTNSTNSILYSYVQMQTTTLSAGSNDTVWVVKAADIQSNLVSSSATDLDYQGISSWNMPLGLILSTTNRAYMTGAYQVME